MTLTELKFSLNPSTEVPTLSAWQDNLSPHVSTLHLSVFLSNEKNMIVNFKVGCFCETETLPGAMSSGISNEYVARENLGVWSLTSLTVMFSLMSDDCFPSSARTRREYLDRRSRSSFLVAIRSPDSGSIRKLSSAPLMMVYVTRALAPWGEIEYFNIGNTYAVFSCIFCSRSGICTGCDIWYDWNANVVN